MPRTRAQIEEDREDSAMIEPVRCYCRAIAEVVEYGCREFRVVCQSHFSPDDWGDCWRGPKRKTPYAAARAWNLVMGAAVQARERRRKWNEAPLPAGTPAGKLLKHVGGWKDERRSGNETA